MESDATRRKPAAGPAPLPTGAAPAPMPGRLPAGPEGGGEARCKRDCSESS